MRILVVFLTAMALTACSSGGSAKSDATDNYPPPTIVQEKAFKSTNGAKAPKPAAAAKVKCKFDTDCMVQNSCAGGKCKLTGTECRFRSDCPTPRGACVNNMCEFN